MGDQERSELRLRLELVSAIKSALIGRDTKVWQDIHEIAWKDATNYANGIIAKYYNSKAPNE